MVGVRVFGLGNLEVGKEFFCRGCCCSLIVCSISVRVVLVYSILIFSLHAIFGIYCKRVFYLDIWKGVR